MSSTGISCEICNFAITKVENYSSHQATHIGVKPFFCTICSKAFLSEPNYCSHLSYHSEGVAEKKLLKKEYVCNICETVCSCYGKLVEHYVDHLVLVNIICDKCKLYFNDEKDYAIHQHLHQNDRVCKICGCEFRTKFEMLKHVQSHNPHKHFSKFNLASRSKKRHSQERNSQKLTISSGELDENLSKPGKQHVKFIRSSKKLKISPSLFGKNLSIKKKIRKKNAKLSHYQKENVKKTKTQVKKFSTSVVNCTSLLVDSSLEKLQGNSKNIPNKDCQQNKTLMLPNFIFPIDSKSPVISCTMNDKVDIKRIKYNSLANSSSKDLMKSKCKSVLSNKGMLIKKSKKQFPPITVLHLYNKTSIDERVNGLKQCSVLINKLPFFVQDYESYMLFMKFSKYHSKKHPNFSVEYIFKCLKHLEHVFQDDVKSISILRLVKNMYENQKSVTAEKKLNLLLFELCTIYYNKSLNDVSNLKSLNYKSITNLYKNYHSALSNTEDIEETLYSLKRRIQKIQKTLNTINTVQQVENLKHLKILLCRLPDSIFKKYLQKKPIILSNVMPIIC